jgi:hypothetical protein
MIIANPIFDTVFKRLMENNRVARFFIETIIGEPIESIAVTPQEHTWFKSPQTVREAGLTSEDLKKIELLSIIRLDYVATIRTGDGYKKVLIEVQKANRSVNLIRFRNYLAEQYKRREKIEKDGEELLVSLPIITIYLLGFELPETDSVAIHVSRIYQDMITNKTLHIKNEFIESLTHDSYVVQLSRIVGKTRTRLEKMLTIFEQKYFIDDKGIIKKYNYDLDDDDIRCMIEILHHTAVDTERQTEIEDEWYSNEILAELYAEKEAKLKKQQEALETMDRVIEEKDKVIEESSKVIEEKDKVIEESSKVIEEKEKAIEEKDREIEEKDEIIRTMQRKLKRLMGE